MIILEKGPHRHCHRRRTLISIGVITILAVSGLMQMGAVAAHANPRYTATPSPHDVISVEMLRLKKQRISYVRHVLSERFHHVLSGKRRQDFTKWIQEKGGTTILSTHGLDIDDAVLDVISVEKREQVLDLSDKTLFPQDKRDLDLVPIIGVPSMYAGQPIHLLDDRPPSLPRLWTRLFILSIKFAPLTTTVWLAMLSSKFREKVWYKWVSTCLSSSGPAFIKWGQWAATRSDMFPEALCDELQHLHNAAPAHSWSYTQKIMESSLGLPRHSLLEVFDWFDPTPVASGSIAQVHKAVLRGDNSDKGVLVAVKVRHPRVAQLIDMDFRIMSGLARMVDLIPSLSSLHVRESVEQFSHTMAAQAYLNVEAHHLEVLNDNFRKWDHVRFPQPFYSSSSVIIETFEPGSPVSRILDMYDALAADVSSEIGSVSVEEFDDEDDGEDSQDLGNELIPVKLAQFIVTTGLSIYLKMLLVDNLMHADLHPGNLMLDIHDDCSSESSSSSNALVPVGIDHVLKNDVCVCLVDAGMVAQLTDDESANFIGVLCSLGEGDGRLAAECALRFSKENSKLTEEERQAFIYDTILVFEERCHGYHTNVDVGHVLRGILSVIRKHHVRIDANYATLVVNALCVESLARRVCPSYNVLDASKPMFQSYRKIAYTKDGVPIKVSHQAVKRAMPFMNFRKDRQDNAFFKQRLRTLKQNRKN